LYIELSFWRVTTEGGRGGISKYLIVAAGLGHISQVSELLIHGAELLAGDPRGLLDGTADGLATHAHFHPLVVRSQLSCHQVCGRQQVLCKQITTSQSCSADVSCRRAAELRIKERKSMDTDGPAPHAHFPPLVVRPSLPSPSRWQAALPILCKQFTTFCPSFVTTSLAGGLLD